MINVSIIIVTYNSEKDIANCLDSVFLTKGELEIEVFVVDNNSSDDTVNIVCTGYPGLKLVANDYNAGFSGANNQGIVLSRGEYVMLLNPDTIVQPDALNEIVQFMDVHADCGICGPVLVDGQGRVAPDLRKPTFANTLLFLAGFRAVLNKLQSSAAIDVISGACLVVRSSIVPIIGVLDPDMHTYEDSDYCARAINYNYRVCKVERATVVHLVGQSTKSNIGFMLEKNYYSQIRYHKKHTDSTLTKCICVLILSEVLLRLSKHYILSCFYRSDSARVKHIVLLDILSKLPRMFAIKCG